MPYSGIMSLALMEGYDLRGVHMDRHGLIPERLDAAFRASGPAVLYCTPTLQAATGSLMPPERRAEIAEIVARHDGWIVEDDAYGFLPPDGVMPLSAFLPERSVYVVSFAKCLSPSLRVGAMVAPAGMRDRIINAIRSTGWMANPIMAEVTTRMIENGLMARQVRAKRAAAAERTEVARARLGPALDPMSDVPAFHVWRRLPPGRAPVGLMTQAAQAGITVATPTPLQPLDTMGNGIRICLGGAPDIAALDTALSTLADILEGTEAMSLV
jgi:DNA-binding transcriptional MocR family regulator